MLSGIRTGRLSLLSVTSIAAVILAAGAGVFSPSSGDGAGTDVLVKINVETPDDWRLLQSLDAKLYFRGRGYALVKLPPHSLDRLDPNNLSWQKLHHDPRKSLYYVMPERGTGNVESLEVPVLVRDQEGSVVSAGFEVAQQARRMGFKVMPLDRELPAWSIGFLDLDFIHDDIVPDEEFQRIIKRVSPDSLAGYIQHLEDYGTRYAHTGQAVAAGQWMLKRLWEFGYPDTLIQSVAIEGKVTLAPGNVIAAKVGSTRPDFRIVVGGHYDSIVSGGAAFAAESAPGADDNASGTAATLEIARVLAGVDLDATVEFVLFTAEELGLLGSAQYVSRIFREGVTSDRLFCINMDMIGNAETLPWKTRVFYNQASEPLAALLAGVGEAYSLGTIPVLSGGMGSSDHESFWQMGYPAIFVHENDFSPHYHTTRDRLDHLEMNYEGEVVKMVLATVMHLAKSAGPPADVAASLYQTGDVRVEWSHSPDADVLGYHLEVVDSSGEIVDKVFTKETSAVVSSGILADTTWVRVRAEDVLGEGDASKAVFIGTGALMMAEAVPNPGVGGTNFQYFLPGVGRPVDVSVRIVDGSGRLVNTLRNASAGRGPGILRWDGTSSDGERVAGGVYFYVFEAAGVGGKSGKVMVVR